jgi:hypothetical protein
MELDESLENGPHARLASMAGDWSGSSAIWFEPGGKPNIESDISFHAEMIAGGRALRLTYSTSINEEPVTGEMLVGCHLHEDTWQAAWVDSFHTGTQLMWLEGTAWSGGDVPRLRGRYPAGDTHWGWQLTLGLEDDELVIVHDNIKPGENPQRAVVWRCTRDAA